MPESLTAPVKAGQVIGKVTYKIGDNVVGTADIAAVEDVGKIGFWTMLPKILRWFIMSPES